MSACCDMHGRNCEPPGELCCHHCPEAAHQMGDAIRGFHLTDGSACSNPDLSGLGYGSFFEVKSNGNLEVLDPRQVSRIEDANGATVGYLVQD